MKPSPPWHQTTAGRIVRWLGSVQLAVPVLILVAAALAWGTYLESTRDAKLAKAVVYGSWWFIGLMGMICVSLVFAVVTRFPWKRRHVGFITVHASLIALIVGGFWSMYGRVEGHIALEQGNASDTLETDEQSLELVQVLAGRHSTIASTLLPPGIGDTAVGGATVRIVDRWENVAEENQITNDSPEPLRAVELVLDATAPASRGQWIGQEDRTGGPSSYRGVQVRVLPAGATWEPPAAASPGVAPSDQDSGYTFLVGAQRYPLMPEGQQVFPGWTVANVKRFEHARVGTDGLTESDPTTSNPAVEILITDGRGTTERHTAFRNFPDIVMSKTVAGESHSDARLAAPGSQPGETLVVHGQPPGLRVAYLASDGTTTQLEHNGPLPWSFAFGPHRATILNHFTHAAVASRLVEAPRAQENRPAVVVRVGSDPAAAPVPIAWKSMAPVPLPGGNILLRYGPRSVELPFSLRLDQFRKSDYPGTDMAMAYESDVIVSIPGLSEQKATIFMNNPFAHAGWKVYQSGFSGNTVSIFSVMRDPGLPLTYAGAIGLCLGILITFYGSGFSWGHPGIPIPFARKEQSNAAPVPLPDRRPSPGAPAADPAGLPLAVGAVGDQPRLDRGPGGGADDAARHLRPQSGGPADRAPELAL
jgi:hypothetical protein